MGQHGGQAGGGRTVDRGEDAASRGQYSTFGRVGHSQIVRQRRGRSVPGGRGKDGLQVQRIAGCQDIGGEGVAAVARGPQDIGIAAVGSLHYTSSI